MFLFTCGGYFNSALLRAYNAPFTYVNKGILLLLLLLLSSAERSSLPDDFLRIAGDHTAPTIAAMQPCSTAANLNVSIEHPTKRGPIIKHIP